MVDTHFSERARELRLLTLLQDSATPLGFGADETSALRVRQQGALRLIEAVGRRGGWVFRSVPSAPGKLEAQAYYLAPGSILRIDATTDALQPDGQPCIEDAAPAPPRDALADGALRDAAAHLGFCKKTALSLRAGDGRATLQRGPRTTVVPGTRGASIGPLRLTWREKGE